MYITNACEHELSGRVRTMRDFWCVQWHEFSVSGRRAVNVLNISTCIYLVGCKHQANEGVCCIGGRGCVLCHFIEPVTFARCAFIFPLRAVGGY